MGGGGKGREEGGEAQCIACMITSPHHNGICNRFSVSPTYLHLHHITLKCVHQHTAHTYPHTTHIDVVVAIPLLDVIKDCGLVKVSKDGHVLHTLSTCMVHRHDHFMGQLSAGVGGFLFEKVREEGRGRKEIGEDKERERGSGEGDEEEGRGRGREERQIRKEDGDYNCGGSGRWKRGH